MFASRAENFCMTALTQVLDLQVLFDESNFNCTDCDEILKIILLVYYTILVLYIHNLFIPPLSLAKYGT